MSATVIGPQVRSFHHPDLDKTKVHSISCIFNFKTLRSIAEELNVPRSNEKGRTILRGFETLSRLEVVKQLAGRKFLIDAGGREIPPAIGHFSDAVLNAASNFIPSAENELFIEDLRGDAYESTRYKLLLKAILWYGRIIHVNGVDSRLIFWELTTEPCGQGLIEAVFMQAAEERDYYVSLTETTDFKLE